MTDQPLTPEREQEIRKVAWEHGQPLIPEPLTDEYLEMVRREGLVVTKPLLAEIDRLRADLATAREALEQAASGFREAYDYGCTWPIGTSDEPQEQRGMARDTFIRNMELLERETRGALDRIGEQ